MSIMELSTEKPLFKGGIDTYIYAFEQLFSDDKDIEVLPIEYLPTHELPLLKSIYKKSVIDETIKSSEPDWIHINGYTSYSVVQSFLSAKRHKKKIIYTAHWHPFNQLRHPVAGRLFFNCLIKPLVKKYADLVITINNEDTAFFRGFTSRVYQIPHWYRGQVMDNSGVKKNKQMILFVGRVADPVKGIEHLYHIPEGEFEIHCVGHGEMPSRSDIIRHINIPDEELLQLYSEASLLVVPSKYEAFSYVALEALLRGTPVLASERVRIGDYIDGVKGFETFRYGNYDEFVEKVKASIGLEVDVKRIFEVFNPTTIKLKYKEAILSK